MDSYDKQKCYEHFRMTLYFIFYWEKIENKIKKKEAHWRKPILSNE